MDLSWTLEACGPAAAQRCDLHSMSRSQNNRNVQRSMSLLPEAIRSKLASSDIANRFVKLVSWTMIAFALDKAAALILVFLLARILGAADYGRLTLAQGLVNTAQIFVVLGAGPMLARYIPAMRQENLRRAVEVINLCSIVVVGASVAFTITSLLGAPYIARIVLNLSPTSNLPYLMMMWVLLTAANGLLLTIMLSFEKGRIMGLVSLITSLMSIAAVPTFALNAGLPGAMATLVVVEVAKVLLLLRLYIKFLNEHNVSIFTPARRDDMPLLWQFGLPVFLNTALWAPTIWLAQFIVKTHAPDGLVAVGVFGFANNLLGAVILFSGLTNRAALPIQSSLHAQGAHQDLRRVSRLLALGQIGAAAIIALPTAVLAPFIMAAAGDEFVSYWPVLIVMISVGVILAGQNALYNYLLVKQGPTFALITLVPWAAIMIGAAVIYAAHGPYALAWGLFVASIVRTGLFLWAWQRSHDPKPSL